MTQIYLISPENFDLEVFSSDLSIALETGLVPVFQLRIKNQSQDFVEKAVLKLKKICHENNCLFILNDDFDLAIKTGCDGVHVGSSDQKIKHIRENCDKNFIIGASCYDSRDLALEAVESGANYISFGTFFQSQTKNSKGKPSPEIISWSNMMFDVQNCAIGGIGAENCGVLVKNKVDLISVISYVWKHEKGIEFALKSLDEAILKNSV